MTIEYYAGIGSRETPEDICSRMEKIARKLRKRNFVLRSGGADRADKAFEAGAGDRKQIFLPWSKFNDSDSELFEQPKRAFEIAERMHPAWHRCGFGARKLHARNVMQVLGPDLRTPSEFVLCWTSDGKDSGGTGQAIRIARHYNIPVFNMHSRLAVSELTEMLRGES